MHLSRNHCSCLHFLHRQTYQLLITVVTAMTFVNGFIFLLAFIFLTVANKVLLHQLPGTLLTQANPLHVWWHLFVQGCKILRIEKLVHLNFPPLSIFHPATTSSTALYQGCQLVVRAQEIATCDAEIYIICLPTNFHINVSLQKKEVSIISMYCLTFCICIGMHAPCQTWPVTVSSSLEGTSDFWVLSPGMEFWAG